jgi:pyruvate/2-oxoglutarate dehydrogenase complex dihydrolipoamide acyltransferase (E2) component
MAIPVRVPRVGQSAEDATVVSWHVRPGARVRAGEVVAVIETDKAEVDVVSPADGTVGLLRAAAGDRCAIGALLVYVLEPGEDEPVEPRRQPVSPRARGRAEELGVDPATVVGSGPDGLVTEGDVERAAAAGAAAPPLDAVRRRSVERITRTWVTTPHFVQMVDVDMTRAERRRESRVAEGGTPAAVSITDLVVFAVARALVSEPAVNAVYDDGAITALGDVDVGIAVDTERGLVVPVLRHVDRLGLVEVSAGIRDLVHRARAGTLAPDDVRGGSASVSNIGARGIKAGTAVLNGPQAALVVVGSVEPRAVVVDGVVAARPTMTLSITFDHRVVDGAPAAAFTAAVKHGLEATEV